MTYLHTGFYEICRTVSRSSYGLCLKRTNIVLNGVIKKEYRRVACDFENQKLNKRISFVFPSKANAKQTDRAFSVMTGPTITLKDVLRALLRHRATEHSSQNCDRPTCLENTLLERFQCNVLRSFLQLVRKIF